MLPKTKMPAEKNVHIVKIAVEIENQIAQLIVFDQRNPLSCIIQELCNNWNISESDRYALQFCDQSNKKYVTERNRIEVKNGSVLRMEFSPAKKSNDILETMKTGNIIEKTKCLENLSMLSSDLTFALEFIREQGLDLVISMIEDENCSGEILKFVLLSFVELMEHETISWDVISPSFISRNIKLINSNSEHKEIIESALSILEHTVQNSSKWNLVERDVTFEIFLNLLRKPTQAIQHNTIALINALFIKADDARKMVIAETFSKKDYRDVILSSAINIDIGAEMAHQLYVLQTLTLGLLEHRMNTKMNAQDQMAHDKIKELRKIAFDDGGDAQQADNMRRPIGTNSNYKKLGFKCDINPAQDFIETPPGILALDCMVYFAKNYIQSYTKVVHENSCRADEHECPFGKTSIELVKLLCEILKIGEPPSDQGRDYYPMFFTHDHPFEEFYCICIVILNKTWKDMRATNEDFNKVINVVKEQINHSLKDRPNNLDDFKTKIQTFNYAEITKIRNQQRSSKEDCDSTASAVVCLKEKLGPEIMSLIKSQRLGYLVEGTRFLKYSRGVRNKDKFWYARLSPNHKVIHYGDCDEKAFPTLEELSNKVCVNDIKELLTGKECPHMKDMRKKAPANLGFSITLENMDHTTLDFVAPDETTYNYWTDGINALLGEVMCSNQMKEDFDTLLSMEIKLRLLDTEGVDISNDPPPIPDDPENYDFCFES